MGGAHTVIERHTSDPVKRMETVGDGESNASIGVSTTYTHTTRDASTKAVHHAAADSGGVSACNQGAECSTSVVTNVNQAYTHSANFRL